LSQLAPGMSSGIEGVPPPPLLLLLPALDEAS
jgi:hypothetical protein